MINVLNVSTWVRVSVGTHLRSKQKRNKNPCFLNIEELLSIVLTSF